MTSRNVNGVPSELLEHARELVEDDYHEGYVDIKIPDRGRSAGEVPYNETVRVALEAYVGRWGDEEAR